MIRIRTSIISIENELSRGCLSPVGLLLKAYEIPDVAEQLIRYRGSRHIHLKNVFQRSQPQVVTPFGQPGGTVESSVDIASQPLNSPDSDELPTGRNADPQRAADAQQHQHRDEQS